MVKKKFRIKYINHFQNLSIADKVLYLSLKKYDLKLR